jgi:hypothetical protein
MTTIPTQLLQACRADQWLSGDVGPCLYEPITSIAGEGFFGVMIGGSVYLSLYFAGGGRATTATVVTILLASAMFPLLPGDFSGIAWAVLFVGGTAAVLQSAQKYVLNPSTTR